MELLRPCWTSESAQAVLNTEALSNVREVFLAVHTPVEGFSVQGIQASDLSAGSEDELLRVLSRPDQQHAFCVVRGEPGSGKSHLIKWLDVKWDVEGDLVLLIRRANGSLEGALEQLEAKLGQEFRELFQQLGRRSKASPAGRAIAFFNMLGATLRTDYFDKPPPDQAWCARFLPEGLFTRPAIRDQWKGAERVLRLIEGRGAGDNGARDSQTADFDLFDIADMVKAGQGDVINSGVRGQTERLWNALRDEALEIEDHRREGWTSDELWRKRPGKFQRSREFVDALNFRRNEAIRYALEVSSDALKKLFRDVRIALQQSGRRLVLLLEDITSFEGIDDSLIDVLVDDAQTQGDTTSQRLCPLISVVGVTPLYYQKLQANYKQRITHEVALGEDVGALQDVAILRSSDVREQFIARYLSAVRAGPARLKEWSEDGERHGAPPPNVCRDCMYQEACFGAFGSVQGRGLFPFNGTAIAQLYEALNPNDQGQTWRTPRGIIKAILSPVLRNPAHIEARQFPHTSIESASLSEERQSGQVVSYDLDRLIGNRIADESQQARVKRLISYWGQPSRIATTHLDGELAFAGVKRSVFDALGLPWVGDEEADVQSARQPEPMPASSTEEGAGDEAPDNGVEPEADARAPAQGPRPGRVTSARPAVPTPPSRQKAMRSDLEKLRADLSRWRGGAHPEMGSKWNEILAEVLQFADLRRYGISPELRRQALTANRIKLEGSAGGDRERLLVPRIDWVIDGLDAYLTLRLEKSADLTPKEHQSRLARLARFSARLEEQAARYILERVPKLADGEPWSPVGALVQILLARELLRGTIPPNASLAERIRIVLGEDLNAQCTPNARTKGWQDFLTATDETHDQMRKQLRSLVNLEGDPTKPLAISGVVDAPLLIEPVKRLRASLTFDPVPSEEFKAVGEADRARVIAMEHGRSVASVPRMELQMMTDRADGVFDALQGATIQSYFERVSACAGSVGELMPQASPEKIVLWREQLSTEAVAPQDLDGVQDLMITLTQESDRLPKAPTDLLHWLVGQPADALQRVWTLSGAARDLIRDLSEHVTRRVDDAKSIPSSDVITSAAAALREVVAVWQARTGAQPNE